MAEIPPNIFRQISADVKKVLYTKVFKAVVKLVFEIHKTVGAKHVFSGIFCVWRQKCFWRKKQIGAKQVFGVEIVFGAKQHFWRQQIIFVPLCIIISAQTHVPKQKSYENETKNKTK